MKSFVGSVMVVVKTMLGLKILLMCTLMGLISSCNRPSSMDINKRLIFSSGSNDIYSINLSGDSKNLNIIYSGDKETVGSISNIANVDTDSILFGECLGKKGCYIKRYFLEGGRHETLRRGNQVSYIPEHETILFYDSGSDGNEWLFSAPLSDPDNAERVAPAPVPVILDNGVRRDVAVAPVLISKNKFAFVSESNKLAIGNISSGDVEEMDINECVPREWISSSKLLLCVNPKTWDPYFYNLISGEKVNLAFEKGGNGFIHDVDSETLIFSRTEPQFPRLETNNLYAYSLDSKEIYFLVEHVALATGVFLPQIPEVVEKTGKQENGKQSGKQDTHD